MSIYIPFLASDNKYYYRTHADGKGPAGAGQIVPTDTLSAGFNTYALMQTDLQAKIFTECSYSEVAF